MKKEYAYGFLASIGLALAYVAIVSLAQGIGHAVNNFIDWWYILLPLLIGFGIQVGLFTYIRQMHKTRTGTAAVAGSAGVSGVSMAACCAHHLSDVLPFIGLSAAAFFLTRYQMFFMVTGLFSNIYGIIFMLQEIKKHSLYKENSPLQRLSKLNIKSITYLTSAAAFIILSTIAYGVR